MTNDIRHINKVLWGKIRNTIFQTLPTIFPWRRTSIC